MAANAQSAQVLVEQITAMLGPPAGEPTTKLVAWSRDEFEVAVQIDEGPHVWVSQRWRPTGQPFKGLEVELYPVGKPRHHHLRTHTPTLAEGHAARCIKNVTGNVSAVVRCVRACAAEAGVLTSGQDSSTME